MILTTAASSSKKMCRHSSWTEALQLLTRKVKVKLSVEECIAVVVSHLQPSSPELYSFEKGRRTFRVGMNGGRNSLLPVFLKIGIWKLCYHTVLQISVVLTHSPHTTKLQKTQKTTQNDTIRD